MIFYISYRTMWCCKAIRLKSSRNSWCFMYGKATVTSSMSTVHSSNSLKQVQYRSNDWSFLSPKKSFASSNKEGVIHLRSWKVLTNTWLWRYDSPFNDVTKSSIYKSKWRKHPKCVAQSSLIQDIDGGPIPGYFCKNWKSPNVTVSTSWYILIKIS